MNSRVMNSDGAIKERKHDKLDRATLAENTAESIVKLPVDEISFVIGVYGKWGSGKTSFLNLIVEALNGKRRKPFQTLKIRQKIRKIKFVVNYFFHKDFCKRVIKSVQDWHSKPAIIHFKPWLFSDYADSKKHGDLIDHFFDELKNQCFKGFHGIVFWNGWLFSNYQKSISSLNPSLFLKFRWGLFFIAMFLAINIIPFLKEFFESFINQTLAIQFLNQYEFFKKSVFTPLAILSDLSLKDICGSIALGLFCIWGFWFLEPKSPADNHDRIKDFLKNSKRKIVVIIDDIDRLEHTQIMDVFRLVKSVADFPNMIYILGMDIDQVAHLLQEHYKYQNGREYIEKFVQYNLSLPPIYGEELLDLFEKELSDQKVFIDKIDLKERWEVGSARKYLRKRLNSFTIRSVNRLANKIGFDYRAIQGHVDLIDFIVLSFMRDYDPEIFWFLEKRERGLSTVDKFSYYLHNKGQQITFLESFLEDNPSFKAKNYMYKKNLEDIFKYLTTGQHVNSFSQKSAAYFKYLPPSYSINRSTLEELVAPETLKNKDEFKRKFQNLCDQYEMPTVAHELNPIVKSFVEPSDRLDEKRRLDYYNCLLYSFKEAKFNFDGFFVGNFCQEWMPSVLEEIQLETKTQGLWMYLDWCRIFSKNNKIPISETKIDEVKKLIHQSTDDLPDDYRFIAYTIPWFFSGSGLDQSGIKLVNDILEQKKESIIEAIKRNHNFNLPFQIKSDSVATSFFKMLKQEDDSLEIIFRDKEPWT
jgi:hypothetical protein